MNPLLNKPLASGAKLPQYSTILHILLRGLICTQWGAAIGSAATKSWDAFAISFWVVFCIFSHQLFFSSKRIGKIWLAENAGISIRRYQTQLSGRHTLLNTIMALNPDTFARDQHQQMLESFDQQTLRWIDPILKDCLDRDNWQEATRMAFIERIHASQASCKERCCNMTHDIAPWQDKYGHNYWCKYIPEGIDMGIKIGEAAGIQTFMDLHPKTAGLRSTEKGTNKQEDFEPNISVEQQGSEHC